MLLLGFQPQFPAAPTIDDAPGRSVDVELPVGGHLAFNTFGQSVEIQVRRGRVWLTDGPVDHVLSGFQSHEAPIRSRVVITALTEAFLTIRPVENR